MRRIAIVVAIATIVVSAWAQVPTGLPIPPQQYAVTHPFGSPGFSDVRHQALGGAYAADATEGWGGNAAGLAAVRHRQSFSMLSSYPFLTVPTIHNRCSAYVFPVGDTGGVKLAWTKVWAGGSITGGAVPIAVDATEHDYCVEYGRQVSPRLALGIGLAYLKTDSTYSIPGMGTVTHLTSRPDAPGGRLGAIYTVNEKLAVGATYDYYIERVTQDASALGLTPQDTRFRSSGPRIGVAWRPDERTMILVDYLDISISGNQVTMMRRPFMWGIERWVGQGALRIGAFDGKLTGGFGYRTGRFDLAYAFTRRGDRDLPGQGGGTAQMLQLVTPF